MRNIIRSIAVISAMIFLFASLGKASVPEQKKTETKNTAKKFKNQTTCLFTGEKIETSSHFDIQGQRIYMCCDGCASKIKADPDKYFKQAAEQGILFENVQERCPISGDKINKDIYLDYNGRRIYFCCSSCIKEFEIDPASALTKMNTPTPDNTKDDSKGAMKQMHHDDKK